MTVHAFGCTLTEGACPAEVQLQSLSYPKAVFKNHG